MSDLNSGFDNGYRPNDASSETSPIADAIATRNRVIEERLNPNQSLPEADVYPILGANFSENDLQHIFPDGTLLPVEDAINESKDVCLFLGKDNTIVGSIQLTPDNGLDNNALTIIDTHIGERWRGQGYGQRLYMELLKTLPAGVEITSHSNLLPDGQRMWNRLVNAGLAEHLGNQGGKEVVGEYRTRLASPLPIKTP